MPRDFISSSEKRRTKKLQTERYAKRASYIYIYIFVFRVGTMCILTFVVCFCRFIFYFIFLFSYIFFFFLRKLLYRELFLRTSRLHSLHFGN